MHRVLKPGGILMISEYPIQSYEGELRSLLSLQIPHIDPLRFLVSNPSIYLHSSPRRVAGINMFRQALEVQGIDLAPWEDMECRLDPSHPLWNNDSVVPPPKPEDVPNLVRGFRSVTLNTRLVPNGPWSTDQTQRIIGGLSRLLTTNFYKALLPMLLMKGMEREKAQEIVDGSLVELMDDRFKSYVKSKIWTARRI